MSKSIPRISVTLPDGGTAAVNSAVFAPNTGVYQGEITLLKVATPNFHNDITVTIAVYDTDGFEKYISSALSRNLKYVLYPSVGNFLVRIPIQKGEYIKVTPSGDPGSGGGTVTVDIEYKPDVFMRL